MNCQDPVSENSPPNSQKRARAQFVQTSHMQFGWSIDVFELSIEASVTVHIKTMCMLRMEEET